MYLLAGPAELLPEEGLNRRQRGQLAALEAAQKARGRDEERAKQQMAAAIGGGDVSWGMGPDAEAEEAEDGGAVDWRRWVAKNTPTEKQQKLLDRIR
jgi:hypothetical protein